MNLLQIWNGLGSSGVAQCTPLNVVITSITGGNRITFDQKCPLTSTEIWADIDGTGYNLLTTLAPGTTTYDHTGLLGNIVTYKLRSKNAGLKAPLNLDSSLNTGVGVTLIWDDNNTDATHIEIWASTDGGAYALIDTIAVGIETYNDTVSDAEMIYKVRAKLAPDYSAYSNTTSESVPSWESEGEVVIKAGNTVGWYDPTDTTLVTSNTGEESIWWDKIYGKDEVLGVIEESGATIAYTIYKITACQANYFYNGCQVGDIWPCGAIKGLSAANSVKKYTGNHLSSPPQSVPGQQPTNHIFDGVDNFMKTPTFVYSQPEFIYMVVKAVSWTLNDCIIDGFGSTSCKVQQITATPKIKTNNGTSTADNANMSVGDLHILRISLTAGGNSLQVDNTAATTGAAGASNMSGITVGAQGGLGIYSNIDVREIVARNITDSAGDQTKIYNYLATKHGLATI